MTNILVLYFLLFFFFCFVKDDDIFFCLIKSKNKRVNKEHYSILFYTIFE